MSPKALAKPKATRGTKMQGPPAKVDDAEKKMSPVSLSDAAPPPKVEEPAAAQDEVAKGMLAAFDDVEAKDERQVLQDAQSLWVDGENGGLVGLAALGGMQMLLVLGRMLRLRGNANASSASCIKRSRARPSQARILSVGSATASAPRARKYLVIGRLISSWSCLRNIRHCSGSRM